MANILNVNVQNIEFIVEHKTLTSDTALSIVECVEKGINFSLSCDRSTIIFSPVNLLAVWVGVQKAQFKYQSINHMQVDISMYLLTHKTFNRINSQLTKDDLLLISR